MLMPPSRRLTTLDGLRGLAAAVVVVHHTLLTSPTLAGAYESPATPATGAAWWLTRTPLHLLWAGGEAVSIFFVLSGYVLWLQMAQADLARWGGYYPQRFIRLYMPVAAAVGLATVLALAVPRHPEHFLSWVVNDQAGPFTTSDVVHSLTLLAGTSPIDSPLWSLRAEVLFSLLLPIYVWGARRVPWWLAALLLAVTLEVGRSTGDFYFINLPMFGFGVLLARHHHQIAYLTSRLRSKHWAALGLLTVALLSAEWTPWTIGRPHLNILTVLGAAMTVALFAHWPAARRVGDSKPAQFFGTISFSLYLIHEPMLVTTAFGLHTENLLTVAVVGIPCAVLAALLLWRVVERPSHRMSGASARAVRKALERRSGTPHPRTAQTDFILSHVDPARAEAWDSR